MIAELGRRMVPGEEFAAASGNAPTIEATIASPDELLRIDVVKDGKYVYTKKVTGRTATVTYRDNQTKAGQSYYYIRVFQRDTENPGGDPEVAWTKSLVRHLQISSAMGAGSRTIKEFQAP